MMHPSLFLTAVVALSTLSEALRSNAKDKVLLSKVQSLTLKDGAKTSARRVSAIPQLKCVGGNAAGHYNIEVMRCKNSGFDYDENDVQWTCTASLPPEFKLGSTDVVCEGYDGPDDPYILKGSCGVEYRLSLTDLGLEKYGRKAKSWSTSGKSDGIHSSSLGEEGDGWLMPTLFWIIFASVACYIIFMACVVRGGDPRRPDTWRPGFGGGGPGGGGPRGPPRPPGGGPPGGGGWFDDNNDPPPPYQPRQPPRQKPYPTPPGQQARQGPGFWSGALGGAAAGYAANAFMNSGRGNTRGGWARNNDPGEGSSRGWGGGGGGGSGSGSGSGSSGPSFSSERQESTGFGSTRRR